jgi:6-hydroxycyclohex-1-ene-1-carbonyl-CoA dehydrogenase
MRVDCWQMVAPGRPLERAVREEPKPGLGEVLVEVAGCGVCHTDLGFLDDGVPTRGKLPLTLGHEISGRVVECGADSGAWLGRSVVVPAVLPCGTCELCRGGRGSICRAQVFPGNDVHGGFASHVRVPARGLCPVPADLRGAAVDLVDLAVLADAITTPFQAIERSGLTSGELAVFVGVGGVGGFGVQIAAARGATVVAIDVDAERLAQIARHGAALTIDASKGDAAAVKTQLRAFTKERRLPAAGVKVFETSGSAAGQELAFQLLGPGGWLGVVGFTPKSVNVRLSNLMAFDATAQGNWGCAPERYPAALDLVLSGRVAVRPFVVRRPMTRVREALDEIRTKRVKQRVVLVPDFQASNP